MKPGGLKSGSKGQFPCDMQERREKSNPPLKSVKKDSTKPDKPKCKPLTGKVFYLDIPSNTLSDKIAKDLKELGGRVEGFLSKDINYLISNKKEAKFAALGQVSPVPSPESVCNGGNSSPHPSSRRDRTDGNTFKLVDTMRMSRGKSLVEKAIKDQELIPSGSILSNALSWGVKILHIDDIKNYIEQKKKDLFLAKKTSTVNNVEKGSADQKVKSKLKNPFLKVEDRRCRYRPFYLQLSSFPVVNYSIPRPCSPFDVEKKNAHGQKQIHNKQRNPTNSDREKRPNHVPPKHKRRKGYCECCMKKYDDLHAHVESEQHQAFAKSSQYQVVDDIISKFSCDFLELRENTPKVKRRKCNVGQFAPLIGTKKDELKERRMRRDIPLRWYSRKSMAMEILKEDSEHIDGYTKSTQNHFTSEPSCSVCSYHTFCSSETSRKLNGNTEKTRIPKNLNLKELVLSTNSVQLHLPKESTAYMKNLPEIYEHCEPLSRQNTLGLSANLNSLHTQILASEYSERNNTLKSKRKLSNAVLLPAKCLKKVATHLPIDKEFVDCNMASHFPRELSVALESEKPSHSLLANKDPILLTDINIQSSPSIKLNKKVIHSLGRNKSGNQKQNMELCLQQAEKPPVLEETNEQSSSTQALLQLFQTSDANSDFRGFSSIQENKDSSLMKNSWEDQHTDALWSLFSTSVSSSPFTGF
ncbi:protein DBF4 homolog A [Pantherophis guttatus]|uniref:Protein DBF4 homolog A n=1 Tax=Pantherophis guttatus TaxID=94885 RepID=A0A6P9AMK6_PANGU|nr:protein DBF4 homolog A [Pantherophis guttatus]XP_034258371.1 protein DBF4 homolog A [Pantherophis guttatus]XP_034258372.1 protein DBF4 homolog A [Pantherophis guttatus]